MLQAQASPFEQGIITGLSPLNCPRVCGEQGLQPGHQMLPHVRNPVGFVVESKQASLRVCLSCVTPKASTGHCIQLHWTGQLIMLRESID